jgi:hypothetical protein
VLVSLPKGTRSVNIDVTWPDGSQQKSAMTSFDRYVTVVKL